MEIREGEKGVEKDEIERCGSLHVARCEGKCSTSAPTCHPMCWVRRLRFSQTPDEKLFCGRNWARFVLPPTPPKFIWGALGGLDGDDLRVFDEGRQRVLGLQGWSGRQSDQWRKRSAKAAGKAPRQHAGRGRGGQRFMRERGWREPYGGST
jgi:hypothetical protein